MKSLLMIGLVIQLLAAVSTAEAALTFTDFTSIDTGGDTASGSLGPVSVTVSGGDISSGATDGSFAGFSSMSFAPPLALSDYVEILATTSESTHTITFGSSVANPRLHLGSLASTLTFEGITLTKLSGQDTFVVAGSTVTGAVLDGASPNDANGTVQLNGSFSSIMFSAQALPDLTGDGIVLQIGADFVENGTVPEPASVTLLGLAAAGLAALRWRRRP